MDSKQLLVEFKNFVSAPNGVEELRQLIMGLGLAGDLLPQNEDLPTNILALIDLAKQRYYANLGLKQKSFLTGGSLLRVFGIPLGWRWTRIGEICDLQTGATPSTQHPEYFGGDIRWL